MSNPNTQKSLWWTASGLSRHVTAAERSNRSMPTVGRAGSETFSSAMLVCPTCQESLLDGEIEGCGIAYCPHFHGMLLRKFQFGQVIERLRANYTGDDEYPNPLDHRELELKRLCPRCHQTMDVHPYHGPGNAVIDSCKRCHVVWLDDGETTRIVRAPGRRGSR